MGRPSESRSAKVLMVAQAIRELRTGDEMPTQSDVAAYLKERKKNGSERSIREYWPYEDAFIRSGIDPGEVGSRADAQHDARVLAEAGWSHAQIADFMFGLGKESSADERERCRVKVRRLLEEDPA